MQVPATGSALAATAAATAPVLDQTKLKTFAAVSAFATLAGAPALIIVTNVQRAATEEAPLKLPKTIATIACVANIVYVSPNIAGLLNLLSDNWYGQVNNAVTILSIAKGMLAIPAAAYNNPGLQMGFAIAETAVNTIWNVPVIANGI